MYGAIAPDLSLLDIKGNLVSWENLKANTCTYALPDQTMRSSPNIRANERFLGKL
jgi:hypothetical protein